MFRIAPGSEVFDLIRLRTVDSLPVAIDQSILPLAAAPSLSESDWTTASLYEELAASGSRLVRADYALEARPATAEQSGLLELDVGAPVLVADTSGYSREGRLIQLGHIVYRGDRYRFQATLIAEASLDPRQH